MEKLLNRILDFLISYLKYDCQTQVNVYVETTQSVTSDCQSIMFDNKGDVNVKINGYPLNVGDTPLMIGTSGLGTDRTRYTISFDGTTTGTDPQVWVIRQVKEYKKVC